MNTGSRPLRVLIADDHQPTLDDVRAALDGDEAFDVCAVAVDAAQAVQAAVRERPDICLLDVRMPGSGVAAVWEIAARLPDVKIVMLTVSDDDKDLFAALRAGADGYLLKTMNLGRLRDALIGVHSGEAAIQRALVARVLNRFHGREPRWRRPVVVAGARIARAAKVNRGDRRRARAFTWRGTGAYRLDRAQARGRRSRRRGGTLPQDTSLN